MLSDRDVAVLVILAGGGPPDVPPSWYPRSVSAAFVLSKNMPLLLKQLGIEWNESVQLSLEAEMKKRIVRHRVDTITNQLLEGNGKDESIDDLDTLIVSGLVKDGCGKDRKDLGKDPKH